ncbi:DUF1289 domain-containing protein [uncultured Brevundimonas sp.]|uniref:DUF1289 domain-containing protein n=1 Tax=uncultured Brevundimonas sp. TaxID=213418 RepID=UPI003453B931
MSSDSPCIDVCRFDGRTGWCVGCGRSVPEIRSWRKMQPRARQLILKDLTRRLRRLKDQGRSQADRPSAAPADLVQNHEK